MFLDKQKRFVLCKGKGGGYHQVCEAVFVTRNFTDLLTYKQKVVLKIYNRYFDEYREIELDRQFFDASIGSRLRAYGLSIDIVSAEGTELFYSYLLSTEKEAEHIYYHSRLGFTKINDQKCFLAHQPIGLLTAAQKQSKFSIPEITQPRGTFRSWRAIMAREVCGRPKLELALALGVLAPVAHLLREEGVIQDLPLVALVGSSSIGKTSVFRIIASIFGAPRVGDGLITNMHSTVNGLFAQMQTRFGFPALFDEVTGTVGLDLTPVIYYLPNGHDKVRCNPDGTLKAPVKFSGAIFFSSERSLFDKTINTGGLHARLVEFPFTWTASRQNAENLEKSLNQNCGTAVYPLISWLFKREDWLAHKFDEEYALLLTLHKKFVTSDSNISNRILKIYALILTSAQVASTVFDLPLAINEMRNLLLKNLRDNAVALATPEDEYEAIKSFIFNNKVQFPAHETNPLLISSIWGFVKYGKEYWIRKDIFDNLLSKISTRNPKAILKDLVHNGKLYKDASRHMLFEEKIAGISSKYYRLLLNSSYAQVPKKNNKTKKAATNMGKSPQLKKLLQ